MKIAVSGTHCMGKSAFIEDFVAQQPFFTISHEISVDNLDIGVPDLFIDASVEGMIEQLDISLARLKDDSSEQNIIYDRCPLDYFVYTCLLLEQEEQQISNTQLFGYIEDIQNVLSSFDYLFFFPITSEENIDTSECEDLTFRRQADDMFKNIIKNDPYDFFIDINSPRLIELSGTRKRRISLSKQLTDI